MKKKPSPLFIGCVSLLFLAFVGVLLVVWPVLWPALVNYPAYLKFDKEVKQLTPKFDSLNEQVFTSLPPPIKGSKQTEKTLEGNGSGSSYGRKLSVDYQVQGSTVKKILDYYEIQLSSANWKVTDRRINDIGFIKGTACLSIVARASIFPGNENSSAGYYYVSIWHDLFNQTFSPVKPNFPAVIINGEKIDLLSFYTFGEVGFITCP